MPVKLVRAPETQHRALKLRIYPTQEQEMLINKTFGCCRQIFNNRLFELIGLDFSPADFYIDSDGSSGKDYGYKAQRQANLKKLTRLQRRLMRKKSGSANREKARVKVACMEHYIAECRNDWRFVIAAGIRIRLPKT